MIEHVCGEGLGLVELGAKVREHIRGQHFEHRDPPVKLGKLGIRHRIILGLKARIRAAFGAPVERAPEPDDPDFSHPLDAIRAARFAARRELTFARIIFALLMTLGAIALVIGAMKGGVL